MFSKLSILSNALPKVKKRIPLTIKHTPIKITMNNGLLIDKIPIMKKMIPKININAEAHFEVPSPLMIPRIPMIINIIAIK